MKFKFLFLLTAVVISFTGVNVNAQQDVSGWYWMNGQPTGHQINWVKAFDAANIFAVTHRGLFMKSTDGGDSWTLTQAGANDFSSGGGAKRDLFTGWFFDANTGIVAGATQTGPTKTVISKTTDGGVTFTNIDVNAAAGSSVNNFYFINSTTGYLCGRTPNAKLYKTTDQGATWTSIASVPANDYFSMHAFDENNIILGTSSRRIVRTSDGGASWIIDTLFSAATNVQFLGMKFKDANTGYVIGNPNYFAYTTNAGVNWTASTHSSIRGQRAIEYDNGVVWTAGDYEYVYRSSNNGVNWDSVKFYDLSNVNQPNPFIIYGIGVKDNDLAVVGATGQMTLSNDGGVTWRNKNYTVNPSAPTYSTIFAQSPTGNVWVGSNITGETNLLFSSNGGTNWTLQPNGMSFAVFGMDFPSANTAYIYGGRASAGVGQMSKSTDGGNTWNALGLPSPLSTYQINTADFINDNTGWAGGIQGIFAPALISKTTDGGTTWNTQPIETGPNGAVVSVQMLDENNGYMLANSLYTTSNGGSNWVKTTNAYVLGTGWSNMFVLNKDVIYLNGSGTSGLKKIIRSVDGGATWTDLTSNLAGAAGTTIFRTKWLNLKHGIIIGASGWAAKTTDGGLTWIQTNPGFSTLVDASFLHKNTWMVVSDRNGSFQVSKKTENITSISVNVTANIEGLWNGKPHVIDTVTVELHNSTSPFAVVDVAKEVITINGYQTYEFSSAPAGSYYIVVKHRNGLETWSAAPVVMAAGGNYDYDFTTASSQAYGNNMILKSGKYCIYSGDANQDGVIDIGDLALIDNDGFAFATGYLATDCNGDGVIDLSDLSIADNNANNNISVLKP